MVFDFDCGNGDTGQGGADDEAASQEGSSIEWDGLGHASTLPACGFIELAPSSSSYERDCLSDSFRVETMELLDFLGHYENEEV